MVVAVRRLLRVGTQESETLNMQLVNIAERAQKWTVPGRFR